MTHTLKRTFATLLLAIFGSAILYNCEPDPDSLGQQLFDKDAVNGTEALFPLVAYNISHNDTVRSDASKLITGMNSAGAAMTVGVLGSFTEGQFGMQKASYLTQLRMPVDNYDFNGPNPVIDSVVLVLKTPANTADNTYYISDSLKAPGAYDNNNFMVGTDKVPVSIEKKSYPVRKYGKIGGASKSMTINVHEVTTFLDTNTPSFTYSNVNVSTGELLGSASFDGTVSTVTVTKKSDNSNLFTSDLGFRMKLSNVDFFKTHIIDKKGKPELQDASNFTRFFKGIRLSVAEDNRYLFQFSPNDMDLIMYYKYDKTDNGVVSRTQTTLKFNLGSLNAHIGQYAYDRTGSKVQTALNSSNQTDGDARLFVQGMGGPSVGIKIKDTDIAALRKKYKDSKIGIVGAKIRVYVDGDATVSNEHYVAGDRKFTLVPPPKKDANGVTTYPFTSDVANGLTMYYFTKKNGDVPEYYDYTVTKTLKDFIEKSDSQSMDALYLDAGVFVRNAQGAAVGAQYTTRATDANRTVLIGSDAANKYKIQLRVTYGSQNQ